MKLARVALGLVVAYVVGWGLVLLANCPDDGPCTGTAHTVWQVGGLAVYASTAGFLLAGVAGVAWAVAWVVEWVIAGLFRCRARRLVR